MAELLLPKQMTRVRFPSPAPFFQRTWRAPPSIDTYGRIMNREPLDLFTDEGFALASGEAMDREKFLVVTPHP